MLRARLEVGHKLKKTLSEVDAMPWDELMLWVALYVVKNEERKKAQRKGKR